MFIQTDLATSSSVRSIHLLPGPGWKENSWKHDLVTFLKYISAVKNCEIYYQLFRR